MNDKDKWSAHLEYLKTAITIAAVILAAASAIYSDPTKIPHDGAKYVLLLSAICVLVTLVSSVMGVIHLSNYLIRSDPNDNTRSTQVTMYSGGSFYGLISAGVFLTIFFGWRAIIGDGGIVATATIDNIIKRAKITVAGQGGYPETAVRLDQLDAKNTFYDMKFSVEGKSYIYSVRFDT